MSNISFFSRLSNLFKGFLSLFVSGMERDNPEIVYQNAIDSMLEKFNRAKDAVAGIIALRQRLEVRLANATRELASVNADLEAALTTNQDDLAVILVQKQEQLQGEVASTTSELAGASKTAEEAKQSLMSVKAEITRLKAEKDEMIAKDQTANARIMLQDQLEGLSVDADLRALDGVREGIKRTVAKADLNAEMAGSDLDNRLAKLRQTSGSVSAAAKVAAMKAARVEAASKSM
jgi:phage shock protein A